MTYAWRSKKKKMASRRASYKKKRKITKTTPVRNVKNDEKVYTKSGRRIFSPDRYAATGAPMYKTPKCYVHKKNINVPTAIYEVELIDEAGAVKPKIRTVQLLKDDMSEEIKDMQKYILIKPSQLQLFFSENPNVDSIFSSKDENIEKRKRFKIRFTSKSTGKKIDLNIAFNKKIKND